MAALSHKLARLVAERIGVILPPRFAVRAFGARIDLVDGAVVFGACHSAAVVDDPRGGTLRRRVVTAVGSILSEIQDELMEHLTMQWPVDSDGSVGMPYVATDQLEVWSGFAREDGTPLLHLRSIRFSDLTGDSD
jgi:hypothetical protein